MPAPRTAAQIEAAKRNLEDARRRHVQFRWETPDDRTFAVPRRKSQTASTARAAKATVSRASEAIRGKRQARSTFEQIHVNKARREGTRVAHRMVRNFIASRRMSTPTTATKVTFGGRRVPIRGTVPPHGSRLTTLGAAQRRRGY